MQINVTFDASVNSAPAAFKTAVNYAVSILDAAFTNNVTVNIKVGWGEVGGKPLDPNDLGESETAIAPAYDFSTITNALLANANSPVQTAADATLPTTDVTGGGIFDIGTAEAKALGLIAAHAPGNDGWVGFASDADWSYTPGVKGDSSQYYFIGTVEHEITEVLGRGSSLGGVSDHFANAWGVEDLFRYSAPGVRELATGGPHSTGYFSIDNGVTDLGNWNNDPNNGDLGDWYSGFGPAGGGPGPGGNDSFNDFSNFGVIDALTESDLTVMNILGWNPSEPANIVINGETYFIASGDDVGNLVVDDGGRLVVGAGGISEAALLNGGDGTVFLGGTANDTMIEAGSTLTVNTGGTLNGAIIDGGTLDLQDGASTGTAQIAFHGPGGELDIEASTAPTNVISGFVTGDSIDFIGAPVGAHPTGAITGRQRAQHFRAQPHLPVAVRPERRFFRTVLSCHRRRQRRHPDLPRSRRVVGDHIRQRHHRRHRRSQRRPHGDADTQHQRGARYRHHQRHADADLERRRHRHLHRRQRLQRPRLHLYGRVGRKHARPHGDSDQPQRRHRAGRQRPRRDPDRRGRQSRGRIADRHRGAASDRHRSGACRTAAPPRAQRLPVTLDFNEPVAVTGGAPTLALNDGGAAVYDAAATAVLGNADKLVFDQLVPPSTASTLTLAVNGLDTHGAGITDLAGNLADVSHVAASFPGTAVNVDVPFFHAASSVQTQVTLVQSDFHLL